MMQSRNGWRALVRSRRDQGGWSPGPVAVAAVAASTGRNRARLIPIVVAVAACVVAPQVARAQTPPVPQPDTIIGEPDTVAAPTTPVADTVQAGAGALPLRTPQPRILLGSPVPDVAMPQLLPDLVQTEVVADVTTVATVDTIRAGVHVVRRGDTLWDLAGAYLRNPFLWPRIFEVNTDVVENPHWIYPAERLRIPGLEGEAVAATEAAATDAGAGAVVVRGSRSDLDAMLLGPTETLHRTRFHMSRKAGVEMAIEDLGALPPVTASEFYAAPWLQDPALLNPAAVLIRIADVSSSRSGATPKAIHPHDLVYLRYGPSQQPQPGDRLLLVRPGRGLEGWGRIIEPTALIRVVSLDQEVMTATIETQFQPVTPGQIAVVAPAAPSFAGEQAEPVQGGVRGMILDFRETQPLYSVADLGFIDLGAEAGLRIGDELVVYMPERRAETRASEALPPEPIARLQVVRTQNQSSTVLVTAVAQPALRPGLPVRVYKKMP